MSSRRTMSARWPLSALAAAACLSLACSSVLVPESSSLCTSDEECPAGQQCNLQIGGLCEPEPTGLPPRSVLGFAIEEFASDAVVDVLACDPVTSTTGNELVLRRDDLFQRLRLSYREVVESVGDTCPAGYASTSQDPSLCEGAFDAALSLAQPSRLGGLPITTTAPYTPEAIGSMAEDGAVPTVEIEWPRSFDIGDDQPLRLVAVDARDDTLPGEYQRAPVNAVGHREGTGTEELALGIVARKRCQRRLLGDIRDYGGTSVDGDQRVEIRFAEPVASSATVVPYETATPCANDSQCPSGEACNPGLGRCGLALEGTLAATPVTTSTTQFSSPLFTHCEPDAQPDTMSFQVRYGPIGAIPSAPTLVAAIDQTLDAGLIGDPLPKTDPLAAPLCVPPWPAATRKTLSLEAPPVTVIDATGATNALRCCDMSECLPAEGVSAVTSTETSPTACTNVGDLSVTSTVTEETLGITAAQWEADGCAPWVSQSDGSIGRHVISVVTIAGEDPPPTDASYCQDGACEVWMSGTTGAPKTYRIDITPPQSALFQSTSVDLVIDDAVGEEIPPITLRPRTLLRGTVSCAPTVAGCVVAGATVIAERLRASPESDGPALRPFLFSQTVLEDGSFVLPVNPGLYVFTTLPPEGQPGGPADFAIVDAREGAPGVQISASQVPSIEVTDGTELLSGRSVRLQLRNFDFSARVLPYDLGSWRSQPDWPTDDDNQPRYDLNDPETCYATTDRGCTIRQITVGSVRPLTSNRAEFTVRSRGGSACP